MKLNKQSRTKILELEIENDLYTKQISLRNVWIEEELKKILPEDIFKLVSGTDEDKIKAGEYTTEQGLHFVMSEDGLEILLYKADKIIASADFRIQPKNN